MTEASSQPPLLDNRYRIEGQVGAGGTAIVYRALDERLGRAVAVKMLRPQLAADPAYLARFSEEARRAAQASHPNIANVLDFNANGPQPYIVMEYVDGVPMNRLAPLPISDAVEYTRQATDALAFLHRNQLVHGDVKPDNLLVNKSGRVKLVDLGIVRPVGAAEGDTILGSPAYIAPERLQGAPLSPLSDVYSLGATLFEALTGRPPFGGATAQEVAAQTLSAEPPALAALRPEVPLAVEGIVARAMAKDPTRRFPDMDSFGRALAGLQMSAGQSTGALPRMAAVPPPVSRPAMPPAQPAAAQRPGYMPPPPQRPVTYTPPTPAPTPAPQRGGIPASLWIMAALLGLVLLGILALTLVRRVLSSGAGGLTPPPIVAVTASPTTNQPAVQPSASPQPSATATRQPPTGTPVPPTATRPPTVSPTSPPPTASPTPPPPTATSGPPPTATAIALPTATGAAPTRPAPTATGAPTGQVEVPGVVGLSEADARRAITAAGLTVGTVSRTPVQGAPRGTVFRQSLPPGQRVARGTALDLVLAQ